MSLRWQRCIAAWSLLVGISSAEAARGQDRPLTISEVERILASAGHRLEWSEADAAEYLAGEYGGRATAALLAILQEPTTAGNIDLQRSALLTGQYGRVGVPVILMLDFANTRRSADENGMLRYTAILALTMRADSSLLPYWRELGRNPDQMIRMLAASGLACAGGTAAMADLDRMVGDTAALVARVARHYRAEAAVHGSAGLMCGGRVTRTQARVYPTSVSARLRNKAREFLRDAP